MGVVNKEKKLRENVETCLEREARQIRETEHRELRPGERDELRVKWEESARRIDASGKLKEVWNNKPGGDQLDTRPQLGCYFGGVNFDKDGKLCKN